MGKVKPMLSTVLMILIGAFLAGVIAGGGGVSLVWTRHYDAIVAEQDKQLSDQAWKIEELETGRVKLVYRTLYNWCIDSNLQMTGRFTPTRCIGVVGMLHASGYHTIENRPGWRDSVIREAQVWQ